MTLARGSRGVGGMLCLGLALAAPGCKGWGQSYAPEYLSEVSLAEGELEGAEARGVYCGCSMDTDYGETQLHCDPKDVPAFGELFFYAPVLGTKHLRSRAAVTMQVGFPEETWATDGFGIAYIEHARGEDLPADPRNPDIFTRASFTYYVTDLYVPEQVVASALDYGVSRTVAESRMKVIFWCEDYQKTIQNTIGGKVVSQRDADAWERRRALLSTLGPELVDRALAGAAPSGEASR